MRTDSQSVITALAANRAACCESYGKLKQHIRNDGLNIPDTFCSLWGA